jgi:Beta-lactamase
MNFAGSKFDAPELWEQNEISESCMMLTSPEKDLALYLVKIAVPDSVDPQESDAVKVSDEAFREINSNFNIEVKTVVTVTSSDSYEKTFIVFYDVPLQESRTVYSKISVYKGYFYVCLLDGLNAAFSKRDAQVLHCLSSWKPSDFAVDDLSESPTHDFTDADVKELDAFIYEAMKKRQIPGGAISIIKSDGTRIYENAFGLKDSTNSLVPVTIDTPFMIGSTTKGLTTLMTCG